MLLWTLWVIRSVIVADFIVDFVVVVAAPVIEDATVGCCWLC